MWGRRRHAPAKASSRNLGEIGARLPMEVVTYDVAGIEQELVRCYTRRTKQSPGAVIFPAAVTEVAGSAVAALGEQTCGGGENCASVPASLPVTAQRSSRKKREIVPPLPLQQQPSFPGAGDGEEDGIAPGFLKAFRRPRRQRKRKLDLDFVPSDSAYFDWVAEYPDEPCPADYQDVNLGEVETINLSDECPLDVSDDTERPMSLNIQTEIQQTRKARRILVEEPLRFPHSLLQRDESVKRHAAVVSESCCTPSEDSTRDSLPDLATEETSVVEEVVLVVAKVKLKKKKHPRPKVKKPPKLQVAKTVPKTPKTSRRKNAAERGAFEHSNAELIVKGAAMRTRSLRATAAAEFDIPQADSGQKAPASEGERQDERAPSRQSAEPADPVPHTLAIDHDSFALTTGQISIDLDIQEPSSGTSTQKESEGGDGEFSVPIVENSPHFIQSAELDEPGGSEVTMEKIPESEVQHPIHCVPNFRGVESNPGAPWTEEMPPSTPRGNATVVLPFASLPAFCDQPSFGDGDCTTDSDGEQAGPIRRNRSQRTRRPLLPEVEAAEKKEFLATSVVAPELPFFRMTEAQQRQHAWALSKDRSFSENPTGLVDEFMRGAPERFLSELKTTTDKPVGDIFDQIDAVDPVGRTPSATHVPLSMKSVAQEQNGAQEKLELVVHGRKPPAKKKSGAHEDLQLVVHGQKSSAIVVHRKEKTKTKYKPKVSLDTTTTETFRRLMLQGGEVKDADHADEDWVEDRKLWNTRVHYFNCVMRQVQGDRTFSKWGGSVLDSMVGAFLTQNVSDFLSSNAFILLRAHFPVREDSNGGSGDSEEQTSVTASGSPVQTSLDTDISTPQTAQDQSDCVGTKANVEDAGIGKRQESVTRMPGADVQDGELVSEVSTTHTRMDTTVVEESLSPGEVAQRDKLDQADPHRFSDEERNVSSRSSSVLEAKFQSTLGSGVLTPDEVVEKMVAATLCAVLSKRITDREAAKGPVAPLEIVRWKKPRNKRSVGTRRVKTKLQSLTGADRGNYELTFQYKLNAAQKRAWEAVRAEVLSNKECGRDPFTMDSVDWEAVRCASLKDVADVIKERGMHYVLSGRVKSLLERIHRDQGTLDLEWIRKLSPIGSKNYLTSVRGLGLKSVECIRLLTLHHPAFPVDTNVGRIVIRLGWVPLMPLPEETQLHLLESYPIQAQIQQYMWPRLCTLDQQTLYEFHYQLITFGKVFCAKIKPNCNACPMRSQCKHYESAYHSGRLLQGPGDALNNSTQQVEPLMSRLPPLESQSLLMFNDLARAPSQAACTPIIEEPNSPENVPDIEETLYTDEICIEEVLSNVDPFDPGPSPRRSDALSLFDKPVEYVDLNEISAQEKRESRAQTMDADAVQEPGEPVEDVEKAIPPSALGEEIAPLPSQALVLLPFRATSFPAAELKNVGRLRTIHYVYELPDHHPVLAELDKRDPEDPCSYLFAICSPGEVPEVIPKISDDDSGNPCACSQPSEATVQGTLLIPCRTAMKGSFPLNGTYFQVNEVFADQASSMMPIDVSRASLWNLRRKFVFMGTSVTNIFRGMCQDEIQFCFKRGYLCVRAFDRRTRQPKLLSSKLHQSGAKIVAKRAPRNKTEKKKKPRRARKR